MYGRVTNIEIIRKPSMASGLKDVNGHQERSAMKKVSRFEIEVFNIKLSIDELTRVLKVSESVLIF